MGDKIVVFGGSGFIGSHVCDKLSDAGYDARIFDIQKSRYLRQDQTMVIGDILDDKQVKKAISGAKAVYNFAGIADIDDASNRPIDTVRYNILGNTIVLEACRLEKSVKRFVFASSMYVYSQSGAFYRASKQAAEDYIQVFHEIYGLEYTILRYGTLYGPRSDSRNAIYRFVVQALKDGIISYNGNKEAKREYIHAGDAARASVEILKPEYANQNIILTGTQLFAVKDLLGMIQEIVSEKVRVEYGSISKKLAHYVLTPYKYSPKVGKKFIPPLQVDLGQGLLRLVEEVYHELHPELNNGDE
jgi:UDP-glucose 4-epimerase